MTIITKPSLFVKKEVLKVPLVHENICDEEKVDIHPPGMPWVGHRPTGGLMCLSLTALLMASVGIVCGLLLYRQYLHTTTNHRYQGFCNVPFSDKEEAHLVWKPDAETQMIGDFLQKADKASKNNELKNNIHNMIDPELLEDTVLEKVDIGDTFEKVFIIDSGRNFEFIHDFTVNLSAIVDDARCFLMTLDPNTVLPPEQLLSTIRAGLPFDVTRMHTSLRADLSAPPPALASAAFLLADACSHKPTYMLHVDDTVLVSKRSAGDDHVGHDYIHFSGKHLQQIKIKNLNDVLRFETNNPSEAAARSLTAVTPRL